jgi:hypothetical protein
MMSTASINHETAQVTEPVSGLGYSTGRCLDGSELLIAMKCYFDGSEGNDSNGDTWITLAGFAAPDKSWGGFENTWGRMLRERYPMAPYIHMWKLVHGNDPFELRAGWTDGKVTALVSDAVELLKMRESLLPFSCRVNLSARQRIISEGHTVDEPMRLCADMCVALSMDWKFRKKIESVYIFFDRGEAFIRPFKRHWLANRTPPSQVSTDPNKRVWDMIANVIEGDTERYPALQAADMIAWATTRDLADKLGELYDLDAYMDSLIPDHHAIIDEALLREKYLID